MNHIKLHSHTYELKISRSYLLKIKTPFFLFGWEGKIGILKGYCRD